MSEIISLAKGQKVDLSKGEEGIKRLLAAAGWDTNKYGGGYDFDLDTKIFLVDASGKIPTKGDFVFYRNLRHSSGAVNHHGDNLTGAGEGDDEIIDMDLEKVPQNIEKVIFAIDIFKADERDQNFGMVDNAFVRICDENGNEKYRLDLSEDYSTSTAVIVGEIYRHNGEWKLTKIGQGLGSTAELHKLYGADKFYA